MKITVSELITKLQELNSPDSLVYINGYEYGYQYPEGIGLEKIILNNMGKSSEEINDNRCLDYAGADEVSYNDNVKYDIIALVISR